MKPIANQSKELTFALDIAHRAGAIALDYYRQGIQATMKADNTPVTVADRECERLIRSALAEAFPDDAILGEEEGETTSHSKTQRRWIIDPIDGTYNFARQVPIWSLLLALEVDDRITVGVVHAPAMRETYWAEKDGGAWRNGERLKVSHIKDLNETMFVFGGPDRILKLGYWAGLERVVAATYRQRAFGDYANFAQVFEGKAEAAFEVGLKSWDLAPLKIIVEEAGGRFSDMDGGDSVHKGSCLISNGLVHDAVFKLLRG